MSHRAPEFALDLKSATSELPLPLVHNLEKVITCEIVQTEESRYPVA